MLSTKAPFPFPGSSALLDDEFWRVLRHNGDGTVTIYREDRRASGHRSVPIDQLTDPESRIALRDDAALAVRLALDIKALDAIRLTDAIDRAQIINARLTPRFRITPARIRSILEDLGWRRAAHSRGPIIFLRAATTIAGEAAA